MSGKTEEKKGRGRPCLFDDPEKEKQLKTIMRFKPTLKDCGAFFEVHPDTIEKFIKRKYKQKYSEFRDAYLVQTRFNIVRALIKSAEGGNIKAIELALGYFLKWHHKSEDQSTGKIEINYNVIPEDNKKAK